jgi:hypothetical protein
LFFEDVSPHLAQFGSVSLQPPDRTLVRLSLAGTQPERYDASAPSMPGFAMAQLRLLGTTIQASTLAPFPHLSTCCAGLRCVAFLPVQERAQAHPSTDQVTGGEPTVSIAEAIVRLSMPA